jgi:hypothetical protein
MFLFVSFLSLLRVSSPTYSHLPAFLARSCCVEDPIIRVFSFQRRTWTAQDALCSLAINDFSWLLPRESRPNAEAALLVFSFQISPFALLRKRSIILQVKFRHDTAGDVVCCVQYIALQPQIPAPRPSLATLEISHFTGLQTRFPEPPFLPLLFPATALRTPSSNPFHQASFRIVLVTIAICSISAESPNFRPVH